MATMWRICLPALSILSGDLLAQPSLGLSAGVAIPGGALADRRTAAPYVAASALFRRDHVVRFRIDLDAARFWGRNLRGLGGLPTEYGDLTVTGALGHLILGHRGREGFYAMLGMGMHWMSIPERPNPYGRVFGAGVGIGAMIPIRRVTLEAELRAHAILSDYGNPEWEISTFRPLMLGLRF